MITNLCDPDFNAYTRRKNPKPKGDITNLRSCGCHIHVGYDNPNINTSVSIVKYLDLFLGVPSVLIDPDVRRRELYGKAGSFRLQPWGVEYRVLSGFFLRNDATLTFMWNNTMTALEAIKNNVKIEPEDTSKIIEAINTSNRDLAKELCDKYNVNYTL